jgi:RNA polymerase sigma-70 factor (ECF subfamily)
VPNSKVPWGVRPASFEELLKAAQAGSREALGRLLESCRQYLLLVSGEELKEEIRAKVAPSDLVQQTFLEAQRDFRSFSGQHHSELLAWLRQILLNNVANENRKFLATQMRNVAKEVPLQTGASDSGPFPNVEAEVLSPRSLVIAREDEEQLKEALQRLGEQDRRVLRLRFEENRSFAEIGNLLDRSAEAARKVWFRAVERLRREMKSHGPRTREQPGRPTGRPSG